MTMQRIDAKVTPEMAQFIMLDELNGRLAKLYDLMDSLHARGDDVNLDRDITASPTLVEFEAIGYTIYNTGSSTVYTGHQGPQVALEGGLTAGQSHQVDLRQRQRVRLWAMCAAGASSSITIRGIV